MVTLGYHDIGIDCDRLPLESKRNFILGETICIAGVFEFEQPTAGTIIRTRIKSNGQTIRSTSKIVYNTTIQTLSGSNLGIGNYTAIWDLGSGEPLDTEDFWVQLPEGFLNIIGITAPTESKEGDQVRVTAHTKNTGGADNFRIEFNSVEIGNYSTELFLNPNEEFNPYSLFHMPAKPVTIQIKTYHLD